MSSSEKIFKKKRLVLLADSEIVSGTSIFVLGISDSVSVLLLSSISVLSDT